MAAISYSWHNGAKSIIKLQANTNTYALTYLFDIQCAYRYLALFCVESSKFVMILIK